MVPEPALTASAGTSWMFLRDTCSLLLGTGRGDSLAARADIRLVSGVDRRTMPPYHIRSLNNRNSETRTVPCTSGSFV